MHGRLVDADARLPGGLGAIHRHVGIAHELFGPVAEMIERHADTRGDAELLGLDRKRGREHFEQTLGEARHLIGSFDVLEQDGELVAAEPGGGVAGPELVLEPLRGSYEQLVARSVTEAVVDRLEPVEVEHDDGKHPEYP